jgi:hypothetical protein
VFLSALLYAKGFVGNIVVPKSINVGTGAFPFPALIVVLLGLFAIQHSLMARQGFKRWWPQIVPRPIERHIYVLISTVRYHWGCN